MQTKTYGATQTNYLSEIPEMTVYDTIKFNLTGTDNNYENCSLSPSDITVIVGETKVTPKDITLGTITSVNNGVTCLLTLEGVSGEGQLKIKIAGGTLTDKAGNVSAETTLTTQVTMYTPELTASFIASRPDAFYGKTVSYSGYSSSYSDGWQIFHSDGANIYLIAKDFISYAQAPQSENYALYKNTDYRLSMNDVYQDYSGTYTNDKAVAFIADTNVWKIFKTGDADWATGGPTIQLFAASYQRTHPSKYIEYDYVSPGYQVKWNTDTNYDYSIGVLSTSEYSNLYVISSQTRANGMWLASPSAVSNARVVGVNYSGHIGSYRYDGDVDSGNDNYYALGFRPLVCLNSGVKLTEGTTYNFDIYE